MSPALPAAVLLAVSASLVGGPSPAAAVEADCSAVQVGTPPAQTVVTRPSTPLDLMRIPEAHDLLRERGVGLGDEVTVAVLDSGVARSPALTIKASTSLTRTPELLDWHGTAVAGLIAGDPRPGGGLVGVAPGASIVDVRVYDERDPADASTRPVDAVGLAAGLRWVLAERARLGIDIVNASVAVPHSPEVERLVARLWRAGVVVVAASGNRQEGGAFDISSTPTPGEDAARLFFPAGYAATVAVSATADGLAAEAPEEEGDQEGAAEAQRGAEDAAAYVLPSSRVDVAAPTYGAVSLAVNGGTCVLDEVATSWSTAEVSGVLALLASLHPRDTPAQLVSRLLVTADGRPDVPTLMTGAGVVQPLEALRQPLGPARDGSLPGTRLERRDQRAVAPPPEADTLAGTRRAAVWWGLLGGGALLLALVLRPVLAGRAARDWSRTGPESTRRRRPGADAVVDGGG